METALSLGLRRCSPHACGFDRNLDRGEPAVPVGHAPRADRETLLLEPLDDRPARPVAARNAVEGADRRDFRGRPAEERLAGDVEELARNLLFDAVETAVPGEVDDGGSRDS